MAELLKELEELLGKLPDQGVTAGSVETESIDALMGALADLEVQI